MLLNISTKLQRTKWWLRWSKLIPVTCWRGPKHTVLLPYQQLKLKPVFGTNCLVRLRRMNLFCRLPKRIALDGARAAKWIWWTNSLTNSLSKFTTALTKRLSLSQCTSGCVSSLTWTQLAKKLSVTITLWRLLRLQGSRRVIVTTVWSNGAEKACAT